MRPILEMTARLKWHCGLSLSLVFSFRPLRDSTIISAGVI